MEEIHPGLRDISRDVIVIVNFQQPIEDHSNLESVYTIIRVNAVSYSTETKFGVQVVNIDKSCGARQCAQNRGHEVVHLSTMGENTYQLEIEGGEATVDKEQLNCFLNIWKATQETRSQVSV